MNEKHGIVCKAESCQYHHPQHQCGLASIAVMPGCGCHSGKAEDESMCGSYAPRK